MHGYQIRMSVLPLEDCKEENFDIVYFYEGRYIQSFLVVIPVRL